MSDCVREMKVFMTKYFHFPHTITQYLPPSLSIATSDSFLLDWLDDPAPSVTLPSLDDINL